MKNGLLILKINMCNNVNTRTYYIHIRILVYLFKLMTIQYYYLSLLYLLLIRKIYSLNFI
jgi:hypothetical protein